MGTTLIACPSCSCHAFAREALCPSCGAPLRTTDGSLQRTAGAVLLGLTLTVSAAACSNETGGGQGGAGGNGGQGGSGGQGNVGGMGGFQAVSAYGAGPSSGFGGVDVGQGGAGGTGGSGGNGGTGG